MATVPAQPDALAATRRSAMSITLRLRLDVRMSRLIEALSVAGTAGSRCSRGDGVVPSGIETVDVCKHNGVVPNGGSAEESPVA